MGSSGPGYLTICCWCQARSTPSQHRNFAWNQESIRVAISDYNALVGNWFYVIDKIILFISWGMYLLFERKTTFPVRVWPCLTKIGFWSKHLTWYQWVNGWVGEVDSQTVDLKEKVLTVEGHLLHQVFSIRENNLCEDKYHENLLWANECHIKPECKPMYCSSLKDCEGDRDFNAVQIVFMSRLEIYSIFVWASHTDTNVKCVNNWLLEVFQNGCLSQTREINTMKRLLVPKR